MCLYRHTQYGCGHSGPDEFVQPCEFYPTCNRQRFQNGIFTSERMSGMCVRQGEEEGPWEVFRELELAWEEVKK
jgi:hypothetical protein